jgi:hypothetical protein
VTQNIFAETIGGDESNTIMLGAHLDSVRAGPGINDDGSGSTLVLELFKALQSYDVKNKIRVAWWGAEEEGMIGSRFYTRNLTSPNINNILVYLNFDMVARGFFGVFDGDGKVHGLKAPVGSDVVEKLFVNALQGRGINVTYAQMRGGSDYNGFMNFLRKPIGGLTTGSGFEQDPCYHKSCDRIENINQFILTTNAKVNK